MITTNQINWIAGILEGEGAFDFYDRKGRCATPRIRLRMTDKDIVEKFKNLTYPTTGRQLGVYNDPRPDVTRKTAYCFDVSGSRAIEWMMTIYPLMGQRRKDQIREVLLKWNPATSFAFGLAKLKNISFIEAKKLLETIQ